MSNQNLSYYNFTYDNEVGKFQYLPYLYNITKEYIDEFNKNILKHKFGFYQTEENPNNYIDEKKRYINDDEIKKLYDERYLKNSILYENLSLEIYNMITYYNKNNDFESQKLYEGYLYKVQNQIRAENKRIRELINKLKIKKPERLEKKSISFNTLIIILFITFSIFIFVYNYYY
jgi:hypothetical protein